MENNFVVTVHFFTSCLVEAGCRVNQVLTKMMNDQKVEGGDIRLMHTNIEPNIPDLVSKYQPQGMQ